MADTEPVLARWTFFRHQLLMAKPFKVILASVAAMTALLAGIQAWRGELADPTQSQFRFLKAIPNWHWQTYVCIALLCLVVLLFETAFRLWKSILVGRNKRALLTNLWNDGSELITGCLQRTLPDPETRLREWTQRVLTAVADLDPSYIPEFSNQSLPPRIGPGPIQFDGYPETDGYRQTFLWLEWRMEKLKTLNSELRKGYVIAMQ